MSQKDASLIYKIAESSPQNFEKTTRRFYLVATILVHHHTNLEYIGKEFFFSYWDPYNRLTSISNYVDLKHLIVNDFIANFKSMFEISSYEIISELNKISTDIILNVTFVNEDKAMEYDLLKPIEKSREIPLCHSGGVYES